MNSWEKFFKTQLPLKEAFFSKLNNSHISDKEYEYVQYVWKKAGCKTMCDYHDIYLKTDVLLLADIFQSFRENALDKYGLDPTLVLFHSRFSMKRTISYNWPKVRAYH